MGLSKSYKICRVVLLSIFCNSIGLFAIENQFTSLDNNNNVVSVWQENAAAGGDGTQIVVRFYNSALDQWSDISTLSTSDTAIDPLVVSRAVNTDTEAVVVWKQTVNGEKVLYASMLTSLASDWSLAKSISSETESVYSTFQLQINDVGKVLVSWTCTDSSASHDALFCVTSEINANNNWDTPVAVSELP